MKYPGAVQDPDGAWISDAEVAETTYTAFESSKHRVAARLIVRSIKDAKYPDALFPVWRYHPFFTNNDEPVDVADITHRKHAIISGSVCDLIDGPLAHIPSGKFGAIVPGMSARRSLTNCCAPQAPLPAVAPGFAVRRCGVGLSRYPPVWLGPPAPRSCICLQVATGQSPLSDCGRVHSPPPEPSGTNRNHDQESQ